MTLQRVKIEISPSGLGGVVSYSSLSGQATLAQSGIADDWSLPILGFLKRRESRFSCSSLEVVSTSLSTYHRPLSCSYFTLLTSVTVHLALDPAGSICTLLVFLLL